MWVLYKCSEIPIYLLVILIKTNRKYTCMECTKECFSNYADISSETEKCMQEKTTSTKPLEKQNTVNGKDNTENSRPDLGISPEDINFSQHTALQITGTEDMQQLTQNEEDSAYQGTQTPTGWTTQRAPEARSKPVCK